MKNIINYSIISGKHWLELEYNVKNEIKKGWQPLGGVCRVYIDYNSECFYQAMVQYE